MAGRATLLYLYQIFVVVLRPIFWKLRKRRWKSFKTIINCTKKKQLAAMATKLTDYDFNLSICYLLYLENWKLNDRYFILNVKWFNLKPFSTILHWIYTTLCHFQDVLWQFRYYRLLFSQRCIGGGGWRGGASVCLPHESTSDKLVSNKHSFCFCLEIWIFGEKSIKNAICSVFFSSLRGTTVTSFL